MKTTDFAEQIKKIDPRLTIIPNENRPGLSNIMFDGRDVCPVPSDEIKEDDDPRYYYVFPNGYSAAHNSVKSALAKIEGLFEKLKDPEKKEAFYSNDV
jgi:hypothetical protein